MSTAHTHGREAERTALGWVLGITAAFFILEVVGALLSASLALLADAGHLLADMGAIILALVAFWYARRPASSTRTYGYMRAEVLGGLLNGLTLAFVAAYVAFEAVRRINAPPEVNGALVLVVGSAGLAGNIAGVLILRRMSSGNLNVRGVFFHLVGDALSSLAVLVSGAVIVLTGWDLADPIIALFITLIILVAAGRLVLTAANILMEAVPSGVSLVKIRDSLLAATGVESVHDLHVWTLTSGCVAMSAHVRLAKIAGDSGALLVGLRRQLKALHGIDHLTLQIEGADVPDEEVHTVGDPRCLA